MKYDMKNILFSLFVFPLVCPVAAQTADTDRPVVDNTIALREIQSSFFSVSTQKTFHLIFPNEVKYFSIGDENVAGEKIEAYPCAIRLKSVVQSFEVYFSLPVNRKRSSIKKIYFIYYSQIKKILRNLSDFVKFYVKNCKK